MKRCYVCLIGEEPRLCSSYEDADWARQGDAQVLVVTELPDGGLRCEVDQWFEKGGYFRIESTKLTEDQLLKVTLISAAGAATEIFNTMS